MKVSASFLSCKDLVKDLVKLNETDVDYIHVDIMDGKFVKNKNLPFKLLDRLSYTLLKRLDVHLMVNKPNKFIEEYATLNSEYITIHVELPKEVIDSSIELIKSYGIKCGLAIKPNTDINLLKDYLDRIITIEDKIIFMLEKKIKIRDIRNLLSISNDKVYAVKRKNRNKN